MTANSKRIVVWAAIGGMVAIALAVSFRPRAVGVDLSPVQPVRLTVTLDEEGRTRIHDVYMLSAPVSGRLQRIDSHVGDQVAVNETVLAKIEPGDPSLLDPRSEAQAKATILAAEAARELALAELRDADVQQEFAKAEMLRMQNLAREGSVSRRDLESAERDYNASQAGLDIARAALQVRSYELELARAQLVSPLTSTRSGQDCECIPITSPVSGRILQIADQSERVVREGETLMQIGDPRDLEIVTDYLSMDAVRIETGQRVIIDRWGGDAPLEGWVRLVEPFGFLKVSALGIEEQRVNVIIDFAGGEGWERLGHGYQVETRVVLWEADGVLAVPLTALFRDGDQWAVFVAERGRARLRHVVTGRRNGVLAEIRQGIAAGEHVILHPSNRVSDGVRITSRS